MRIGICAYSPRHVTTWVLPHILRALGQISPLPHISLRSLHPLGDVDPLITRHFCCRQGKQPFSEWSADRSHVLWLYRPGDDQLDWLLEQKVPSTLLTTIWDVPRDIVDRPTYYRGFRSVCTPSYVSELDLSRNFVGAQHYLLRWSPNLPVIRRRGSRNDLRELCHIGLLCYGDAVGTSREAVVMLAQLADRYQRICLHIFLTSKRGNLAQAAFRVKRRLPSRCQVYVERMPDMVLYRLPFLHLAVVAATQLSFAVPILDALHMGVPVVTWDGPYTTEYITTGLSGILVPTLYMANTLGVFQPIPNWIRMEEAITGLINDRRQLRLMSENTAHGLLSAGKGLVDKLAAILS